MDILEIIRSRRSVRKYNNRQINDEQYKQLIEAAIWAPSACNIQGWKFIVIEDKIILNNIIERGTATFLKNSTSAILVLYDNRTDNIEYQDHIQSASAATQNMILMAHRLGIGTCWICHLPPKSYLRKLLDIPHNYDPIAMISLGFYDQSLNSRKRKYQVEEVMCYNRFDFDEIIPQKFDAKLILKRIVRKIYFLLPWKPYIKEIALKFEKKFDN